MKPNEPLVDWGFEHLGPTSPCGFFVLSSVEETQGATLRNEKENSVDGDISLLRIFSFAHFHQEAEMNKGPA